VERKGKTGAGTIRIGRGEEVTDDTGKGRPEGDTNCGESYP